MDPAFWHQRWHDNRIGFHQDKPTPLLLKHWDAVGAAAGARVFVPLCGKSLDLAWFASRGHRVLGVELSPLAIGQFFAEQGLQPTVRESRHGRQFQAGPVEILCADVFDLDAGLLADCDAVYDRAALIALPPDLRRRYAGEVYARLPRGCRGLLVTLEYPQHEKAGPPFSVPADEVRALHGADWELDLLERRDILAQQPGFQADGVTDLHTGAWRLQRR